MRSAYLCHVPIRYRFHVYSYASSGREKPSGCPEGCLAARCGAYLQGVAPKSSSLFGGLRREKFPQLFYSARQSHSVRQRALIRNDRLGEIPGKKIPAPQHHPSSSMMAFARQMAFPAQKSVLPQIRLSHASTVWNFAPSLFRLTAYSALAPLLSCFPHYPLQAESHVPGLGSI